MTNSEKKLNLQELLDGEYRNEDPYYVYLKVAGDEKTNYHEYMTTAPINAAAELKRVLDADYALCTALLTMILREDHFCNGSFDRRYRDGEVNLIIRRMIEVL